MTLAHPALDFATIRDDFPILAREVHGHRLVYLDSAATSQKPRRVIDALVDYYQGYNANVHRGVHHLADLATDAYEGARAKVARFIGADDPRGVVFTRNATEAINLIAGAWGQSSLRPGDEIITTEMEHHSNLVPWQILASATGATLRVVPVGPVAGELDLVQLAHLCTDRTRLVALTHCSNVLGTINRVEQVSELAQARGIRVLVDAAQSAPHMPLDVTAMGADFVAFSGHKMCGPTGIGVLWARPELLDRMPPFLSGGSMIREVWNDHATWAEIPARFEAGTPSIADAIGLGAAIDYLSEVRMARVRAHEVELTTEVLDRMSAVPGLRVYGPPAGDERSGVVSFNLYDGDSLIHPHDVGTVLDGLGIAIRVGHHCCNPLMRRLGIPASARASFYLYNTHDDVDRLMDGLEVCRRLLGR